MRSDEKPDEDFITPSIPFAKFTARLQAIRVTREAAKADVATAALASAAAGDTNLLPKNLECVEAHVTIGEISHTLRKVWGEYHEAVTV